MTTIAHDAPVVTLVNVFQLKDPTQQQNLINLLIEATERTMRWQPGFVSANLHRSLDGSHVVNYAQWRSAADFLKMRENPEAQEHMVKAFALANVEGHLYEVAYIDEASESSNASHSR